MIVSHRYRFIFLKTRKTAGTSIEISLSRYCGEDDVLTPLAAPDEAVRAGLGLAPQNHCFRLRDHTIGEWLARGLGGRPRSGCKFYNHMSAAEIRHRVGARVWRRYFKFCFERNPWDKVISQYWFENQGKADFNEFLRTAELYSDFDLYSLDGRPAMNFIGRYESLAEDLGRVCAQLGIPFDGWLPRAKGNYRKDRRPYTECYDTVQADIVARRMAREVAYFGYRFGAESSGNSA